MIVATIAPVLEAVELYNVKFNGTLNHPSVFRGEPNPELDAAWDRIAMDPRPFRVTSEILEKIGQPERPSSVRFSDEDGGGFMATIEVSHQVHCLNMLRKHTYFDYYESSDISVADGPEVYRMHLDHCIEMLRQLILCTADVGVITYDWVQGYSRPYPNFNTLHTCRNADRILEWNERNGLHEPLSRLVRLDHEVDLDIAP
ncbi:hypothetical protein IEO21_09655 [Rhodonia placenta]|uniref:Tat pathway signal sequence n=1 Tax=Rhodonia placenta TaxID=104341 RepID=A0A8H7NTX9_9APHY|nr:hypothetical protein IEO21_09655 [Postia placenta]